MERVLQNNLKPATHFIEVYGNGLHTFSSPDGCIVVDFLYHDLQHTARTKGLYTVAIFKIRAK